MDDDEHGPRCFSFRRRRWGWIVTIATFLIQLLGVGLLYSFGVVTIAMQEEFEVGVTTAVWIPTIATGLNLIGGVLTAEIVKKTSHRLVAVLGISFCFCACLITSFMPRFFPIIFTFGITYGIGLALSTITGMITIVEWFPKTSCARALAFAVAGTSTGMLVLNPVMYKLVSGVGWRNALRIMGSVLLLVGYAASATFSKPVRKSGTPTSADDKPSGMDSIETTVSFLGTAEGAIESPICDGTTKSSSLSDVADRSRNSYDLLLFPEFWMMFFGMIISAMSTTLFFFYWVKLILTLGFRESTAALAMTALGASDLVGKLLVSGFADYLPFPKLFLFHIASVSGIGLMFAVLNIKTVVAVFITSVAIGVFVLSLINSSPYIVSAQVFPGRGATPMTTSLIAPGIGTILGTVYGTSVDQTGSFDGTLYGCMGAYALAILLFSSVPLYQKLFASERYVMWDDVYRYRGDNGSRGSIQRKKDLH
ncbi:monocarboxylate transporter 13-like [Strongylocentrotus purpuratus]|uniref:Major facilitator superfamily (MFS) profile domain-containing protein n=1 Tax=Strongylocentrotus purpuratus TaxID=7668 RepID=A0A7M7PUI6_STRPU|nr:monocarboxylate transporter 13-like [Strongylocentrotus purpuratus]